MSKKVKKNNSMIKYLFILVVIVIVIGISYLGKYIYNKYLEYEDNNKEVIIYK